MKTLLQDRSRPAGGYRDAGAGGGGSRRERRCRGDLAVTESDKHLQSEAKGKKLANLFLFGRAIYSTEGQRMWPTLGGDDEQATSSEKFIAKRAWCEEWDGTGNHPGKKSGLNIISITCRENKCEKHAY